MPVFDWLRTDLAREIPEDGSNSLYYDEAELLGMTPLQIVENTTRDSHGFTLPGWEPERLKELEKVLKLYENVKPDDLRANYKYFSSASSRPARSAASAWPCIQTTPRGPSSAFRA